jgi:hypothetical protein
LFISYSIISLDDRLCTKRECIPLNVEEDRAHKIAHILSCPLGKLPLKYLGVPLHFERLKRENLQPVLDKLLKMISSCRGGC